MNKLWLIPALILSLSCQKAQEMEQGTKSALDQIFDREGADQAPALVVGIWQKGQLVYEYTSGKANLEQHTQVDQTTPFHIGFLTQQFVEYAIDQLINEGKLKANAPITQYLDELPEHFEKVKVKHLLNHSSGLLDYWAMRTLAGWGYDDPMNTAQAMEMISSIHHLNQEPGTKVLYANTNPFLLARIVEKVSGLPIETYLKENIFNRLNMNEAFVSQDNSSLIQSRANDYLNDGEEWKRTFGHHHDVGPIGIYASLNDLHKWQAHIKGIKTDNAITLWEKQSHLGKEYQFRNGFYFGYRGFMGEFGEDYSVIILSADYYLNSGNQAKEVMGILNPGPNDQASPSTANSSADYSESFDPDIYTGDYWDPIEFHSRSIRFENDTLYYITPDNWKSPLEPIGKHEFKMTRSSIGRKVWFDSSGLEPMMAVGASQENAYRYYAYESASPSQAELRAYAGTYYLPELKAIYELYIEDGRLYAKHNRTSALRLDPLDKDRFANEDEWYFSTIRFQRDSRNQMTGFVLSTPELNNLLFHKITLPK